MIRKLVTTAAAAALAVAGLLLSAAPAKAQQGWPYQGNDWGYRAETSGSGSGGQGYGQNYSWSYYAPAPASFFPTATYPPLGEVPSAPSGAQESNPYLTAAEFEAPRAAQINVRLPLGAVIWFNNTQMPQTGALRSFASPPLEPGEDYSYQVKVRWDEGGRDVTHTRNVTVHAGDRVNLAFGPKTEAARR